MRTLEQVAAALPHCRDRERRSLILQDAALNGIDYVEYEHREAEPQPHVLVVHFLEPLPDPDSADGAYDLTTTPSNVILEGGKRIVGIEILAVRRPAAPHDDRLEIVLDRAGDFSIYWLGLGWQRRPDGEWAHTIAGLDSAFSITPVSFKACCPVDFDCHEEPYCPPEERPEPRIDYLAKDYASFRQLLVDVIPQINPDWLERNPADLGIALLELLAYEGDRLSYFQDAVAQEAHLETLRRRISARRHGRLIDYRMHDGRNAWTWVHVRTASTGAIDRGTRVLTRVNAPLLGEAAPPDASVELPDEAFETDPALAEVSVFETTHALEVAPVNNDISLHDHGNLECCLPTGTTEASLFAADPADPSTAVRPQLQEGDYLLLEEVRGPLTGLAADADRDHRQVVRLTRAAATTDEAFSDRLVDGRPQPRSAGDDPLPLLQVRWARREALCFPLCLSSKEPSGRHLHGISLARGNLVLADHGLTVVEEIELDRPVEPAERLRLALGEAPLTFQLQPVDAVYDGSGAVLASDRTEVRGDAAEAMPAIALMAQHAAGTDLYRPFPDLLDSPAAARHFVAEVDREGRATLRFGDDEYGAIPSGVTGFTASYRIGNGRAGNVGADALAHLVKPAVAPAWPDVEAVRNPIAAGGGSDARTIEEMRRWAPAAFRAEQFRAVIEQDYADAADKMNDVAGAVAAFRWTGSWYTVFVGIDPADPADLITEPGGRTRLSDPLERAVRAFLNRYRLAGFDLEIRSARYVALEIDLDLCVLPTYFRGDVGEAVRRALGNRVNNDGTKGFFHPDNFTFGDPVYLSRLIAAVEAVEGVDSVVVTRFRRFGELDDGELARGVIPIGGWEIARLDNDPNFMENGVLRLHVGGGK